MDQYDDDDDDNDNGKTVPTWEAGVPEEHGLSSEGLEDVADLAEQLGSNCLLIAHEGEILGEWYWNGFGPEIDNPDVFSITKSVTSAIVGVADKQGHLDVDDRVSDYVEEWQNSPSENVTIRQLLVHDSGRTFDLAAEWGLLGVYDQTAYSLAVGQEAEPGSQWEYTNLGYQAIEAVLDVALGGDVEGFAQQELFLPLGMSVDMGQDPAGNTTLYSGMSASCRDLAKLAQLFLDRGDYGSQRILRHNWTKRSMERSTTYNDAYGIGWWLNNEGHVILPQVQYPFEYDGRFLPSGPESVVTALGAFGNGLMFDPERGYVVVRLTSEWKLNDVLSLWEIDSIWAAFEDAVI